MEQLEENLSGTDQLLFWAEKVITDKSSREWEKKIGFNLLVFLAEKGIPHKKIQSIIKRCHLDEKQSMEFLSLLHKP